MYNQKYTYIFKFQKSMGFNAEEGGFQAFKDQKDLLLSELFEEKPRVVNLFHFQATFLFLFFNSNIHNMILT
jgi:hypothetical protein